MKLAVSTTLIATRMLYVCLSREVDITVDGANDTNDTEIELPLTPSQRGPIYEALGGLNPNTLNLTIYWHCISTGYVWLRQYGSFQKDDEAYLKCKGDGHYLYERSCLHHLLVASNCVNGIWDCGVQWYDVDFAISQIHNYANAYPQCFTDFNAMDSYELTWDCEERCDLPCSYPEQFCTTIRKSYNSSVCEMECAEDRRSGRRLRQDAHDMKLEFGSSSSPAATSASPNSGDGDDVTSTTAPPTLAPESQTEAPTASTLAPESLNEAPTASETEASETEEPTGQSDAAHSCRQRAIIAGSIAVYALALATKL